VNASQQSTVGFDEFMKVQAWCADVYSGDQHRLQSFSCELRFCVRPHVIHQGKNAFNGQKSSMLKGSKWLSKAAKQTMQLIMWIEFCPAQDVWS